MDNSAVWSIVTVLMVFVWTTLYALLRIRYAIKNLELAVRDHTNRTLHATKKERP